MSNAFENHRTSFWLDRRESGCSSWIPHRSINLIDEDVIKEFQRIKSTNTEFRWRLRRSVEATME